MISKARLQQGLSLYVPGYCCFCFRVVHSLVPRENKMFRHHRHPIRYRFHYRCQDHLGLRPYFGPGLILLRYRSFDALSLPCPEERIIQNQDSTSGSQSPSQQAPMRLGLISHWVHLSWTKSLPLFLTGAEQTHVALGHNRSSPFLRNILFVTAALESHSCRCCDRA